VHILEALPRKPLIQPHYLQVANCRRRNRESLSFKTYSESDKVTPHNRSYPMVKINIVIEMPNSSIDYHNFTQDILSLKLVGVRKEDLVIFGIISQYKRPLKGYEWLYIYPRL
jgi:hypothetical protein